MIKHPFITKASSYKFTRQNVAFKVFQKKKRKECRDRAYAFVSYIDTKTSYDDLAYSKKKPVDLNYEILDKYFGSKHTCEATKKILREIEILKITKGVKVSSYGYNSTFYDPSVEMCKESAKTYIDELPDSENILKYLHELEDIISDYYEKHKKENPEEYKKLDEEYHEVWFNADTADKITQKKFGVTYAYTKENFMEFRKKYPKEAIRMSLIHAAEESLNGKKYKTKIAHGRAYNYIHTLPKDYRDCLENNHEQIVEASDVHAMFVLIMLSCAFVYFEERKDRKGMKEVSEALLFFTNAENDLYNYIAENSDNSILYSIYNDKDSIRKDAKKSLLSFMFSSNSQRRLKEMTYTKLEQALGPKKIKSAIKHSIEINKLMQDYSNPSDIVLDYKYEKEFSPIFKSHIISNYKKNLERKENDSKNKDSRGDTIDSHPYSERKIDKTFVSLFDAMENRSAAERKADYLYMNFMITAAFYHHIADSALQKSFKKFREFLIFSADACKKVEDMNLKPIVNRLKSLAKQKRQKGLLTPVLKFMANLPRLNMSIISQRIESKIIIELILPALRKAFPQYIWISLHDAILCSKGALKFISEEVLNKMVFNSMLIVSRATVKSSGIL